MQLDKRCDKKRHVQVEKRTDARSGARAESNRVRASAEQRGAHQSWHDASWTAEPTYTAQGAKCEVWYEDDWWAATVVVRRQDTLRVSYVGGTDDENEWLAAAVWPTRLRARVVEEEVADDDEGDSADYRGVQLQTNGTWFCVVDALEYLMPDQMPLERSDADECTPVSVDSGAGAGAAATNISKEVMKRSKLSLGAFTSKREAAQLFDCVMLRVCGEGSGVPLNLASSKKYLAECDKGERNIFPDDFDSSQRDAVKRHFDEASKLPFVEQADTHHLLEQALVAHTLQTGLETGLDAGLQTTEPLPRDTPLDKPLDTASQDTAPQETAGHEEAADVAPTKLGADHRDIVCAQPRNSLFENEARGVDCMESMHNMHVPLLSAGDVARLPLPVTLPPLEPLPYVSL